MNPMSESAATRTACGWFLAALTVGAGAAGAVEWRREILVPGMAGGPAGVAPHGLTGLSFGPDGALYVASFVGPGIFKFDLAAGTFSEEVGGLDAAADDVAVAADGTLAWTGLGDGKLWMRKPGGTPVAVAENLPLINPVAFTKDGKVLTGQIGQTDTLLEVDPSTKSIRVIARGLGGINAFQPDGKGGLWVPLAEKGAVGRVDLESGHLEVVAGGLGQPVAVKSDSTGGLYTIDWRTGRVFHVNPVSGETKKIATVPPPLDNLAIGPDDTIYVTRPVDNAVIAVDPVTGAQRTVFQGVLSAPAGLTTATANGKALLLVADAYGTRTIDLASRRVTSPPFDLMVNAGSMVAASDKSLALTNVRRGTLVLIDRATGRARQSLGGFTTPMGVIMEDESTVLVASYGTGEIIRVKPGAKPERATVIAGLQGPVGLAMAADGRWYITEADAGRLVSIDPATGDRTVIVDRLDQPEGLAVLTDGRIAVAEVGRRRLFIIAPISGDMDIVAEDLPIGAVFTRAPAPVYLPTGVAADADGNLYVSCDRDNTVLKFLPQ